MISIDGKNVDWYGEKHQLTRSIQIKETRLHVAEFIIFIKSFILIVIDQLYNSTIVQ